MNYAPNAAICLRQLRLAIGPLPACIAGSTIAGYAHDMDVPFADIDVFCATSTALMVGVQRLLTKDYTLDDRNSKVYDRWLRYGFSSWHTNSLKLQAPSNAYEVNMVYKLQGKHPLSSLPQVLESFDFGLLAVGIDLNGPFDRTPGKPVEYQDMRGFFFPRHAIGPSHPLPMLPQKEEQWLSGRISRYNGLREAGRYAKYVGYGFDLSLVKPTLLTGYAEVQKYHRHRAATDPHAGDHLLLADIYEVLADNIGNDNVRELIEANKVILTLDSLDAIMDELA